MYAMLTRSIVKFMFVLYVMMPIRRKLTNGAVFAYLDVCFLSC